MKWKAITFILLYLLVETTLCERIIERSIKNGIKIYCITNTCGKFSNTYPGFCTVNNTRDVCKPCPPGTCLESDTDLNTGDFTGFEPKSYCLPFDFNCDLLSGTVFIDYRPENSACPVCRCKRGQGYINLSPGGTCEDASGLYPECTGKNNLHQYLSINGCKHCAENHLRNLTSGICEELTQKDPDDSSIVHFPGKSTPPAVNRNTLDRDKAASSESPKTNGNSQVVAASWIAISLCLLCFYFSRS